MFAPPLHLLATLVNCLMGSGWPVTFASSSGVSCSIQVFELVMVSSSDQRELKGWLSDLFTESGGSIVFTSRLKVSF